MSADLRCASKSLKTSRALVSSCTTACAWQHHWLGGMDCRGKVFVVMQQGP